MSFMASDKSFSEKREAKIRIARKYASIYECLALQCYETPDQIQAREALSFAFEKAEKAIETSFIATPLPQDYRQLELVYG
jgi:hypothetical protein